MQLPPYLSPRFLIKSGASTLGRSELFLGATLFVLHARTATEVDMGMLLYHLSHLGKTFGRVGRSCTLP